MLKIAITGNIASGKSTVEGLIRDHYPVLDSDAIAHSLLEKDKKIQIQIKELFKDYDILENGKISRPKLGKIIFGNSTSKKKLEEILHPIIKTKIEHYFIQSEKKGEKVVFIAVPLLYEAKLENIFDKVLFIATEDEIRLERLIKRNNLPPQEAKMRLNSQISQEAKIPLADYVIYNNKDFKELTLKTNEFLNYLSKNSTFPESK